MKSILFIGILTTLFGTNFCLSGYATTTRYYLANNNQDACGCIGLGGWKYTAAASFPIFSKAKNTWCGVGCGQCFRLTSTGKSATPYTGTGGSGVIDVMVTDCCPIKGNEVWCTDPNQYGYTYHFDLNNGDGQIDAIGWNNPVVQFQSIPCELANTNKWKTCKCHGQNTN